MAVKLTYHPNLYLGDSINVEKLDKIKRKLENKPLLAGVFVIALSGNPEDQLEFMRQSSLRRAITKRTLPLWWGLPEAMTRPCGRWNGLRRIV